MGRKILFITTDQQRYDALGCNGGSVARTPVVDALAAQGIVYDRAHPQNVVCMPSRSTMLTGQHVSTHGVWMNGVPLSSDAPSIASDLRKAGYRTALIGSGWWGMNILREAIASGECTCVGFADPDPAQIAVAKAELAKFSADQPREYRDYRELLAKERPDIAIVATPDHWHALPTIAALKAGAHVYVDKPTAHTIGESQAMLKAARAAGRVVQVGTHRRMAPHLIRAREFFRSGQVGTVGMIRCHLNLDGTGPEQHVPVRLAGLEVQTGCDAVVAQGIDAAVQHDRRRTIGATQT